MWNCRDIDPRIDALADGEGDDETTAAVRAHLEACRECRKELKLRVRLKLRIIDAGLPGAPPEFRTRLSKALDREDRPARRRWWAAASAAAVLVTATILFFASPAPALPSIVSASSEFHDRVISGAVAADPVASAEALRTYFRERLKLEVAAPDVGGGCCISGACPCPIPASGTAAPWIVYRRGDAVVSLLVLETDEPLPESSRRSYANRPYHVFRAGLNTVIACRSGRLCHLWIARLDEKAMLDLLLETPEGRKAFAGERLTLRGVTCRACCATVEAKARAIPGVGDACVDLESMELIVTGEKLDLDRVIDALKQAGVDAERRR